MSAKLSLTDRLEQIQKFWLDKQKEEAEKAKKENEDILKQLGLSKMFENSKRKNELFMLMNEDFEESKSIFKSAKKSAEIYNKTFDSLDKGSFKPIVMKLFDIAKEELKDEAKDKVKDTFEDYFGDKLNEAKEMGLGENFTDVKDIIDSVKDKVKDTFEGEDSSSSTSNKQASKNKNYERLRLRYR